MQKPELIFNREDATDFRLSPLELNLPMIQATAKFLHSMQQEQSEVTIALFAWGTRILETSLSKPTSPKEINSQLIVDCMAATVRYADAFKRLCDAAQGTPDALKKYGVMNQDERELLRHRLAKDGVLLHLHGNRSATQQIDPLVQELAYGTRAARVNVEQ